MMVIRNIKVNQFNLKITNSLFNKVVWIASFMLFTVTEVQAVPPVYENVSTATAGTNTTSLTIITPLGTTAGDFLLATISTDGSEIFNPTTGWVLLRQQNNNGSTLAVFYRIATGSENPNYTFTWGSTEQAAGSILRYSGVDTSDPIDLSAIASGSTNQPTAPSVTTTVDDTLVVRTFGADDDDIPFTGPTGHVKRVELESNAGIGTTTLGVADTTQGTAGSTGSAVFDLAGTGNERWVAVTVAIKPTQVDQCDPVASGNIDTDGDDVSDVCDIDDDNDGIIDEDEGAFNFSNLFTSLRLSGDASLISAIEVQLTPNLNDQRGSAMSNNRLNLQHDFTFDAELYLGNNNGGADGLAFVLHNSPAGNTAVGAPGGGIGSLGDSSTGVAGIQDGIAIEFDTYYNGGTSDDLTTDHTQIRDTDYDFQDSTNGRITTVNDLGDIEDGAWHSFHLEWNATTGVLSYAIDNVLMNSYTDINISNTRFGGSSMVHFGFTSSTGGATNDQRVRELRYDGRFIDNDSDGLDDYQDLDSDNDGIPDNIEAQPTDTYLLPSGTVTVDGLWDNYGTGLTLENTDGDANPDYLDNDSDDDGWTDCNESLTNAAAAPVTVSCPVNAANVGNNGLIDWAETADDYSDVNGKVDEPNPDSIGQLLDEISANDEAAYREEVICSRARGRLTAFHWTIISFSCETGTNTISDLLSNSLGAYGNGTGQHWVMFEQTGTDDYVGNPNTETRRMYPTNTVVPGKGYWIITDLNQTWAVDTNLSSLSKTVGTLAVDHNVSSPNFTDVKSYTLTDTSSTELKKLMLGNPFHKTFEVGDLFLKHGGGNFAPMSQQGDYIYNSVYQHDSTSLSGLEYDVVSATPGLQHTIESGVGFWVILKTNADETSNIIDYPLAK